MNINDINLWLDSNFNQEKIPPIFHPFELDNNNTIIFSKLGGIWIYKTKFYEKSIWCFHKISEDDGYYWITEITHPRNVYWLKDEIKLNQFVIDYLKEKKNYEFED